MSRVLEIAQELTRVRAIAQTTEHPRDLMSSYAECMFLDKYGKLPDLNDLRRDSKRKISLITADFSGKSIRVISRDSYPMRVYKRWLDTDIYVFARTGRLPEMTIILGWLPRHLVEAFPTTQFPPPYPKMKSDYSHDVTPDFLIKMPDSFVFEEAAHHAENNWNGLWDEIVDGWECLSCGRLIPDARMRKLAMREREDESGRNDS